MHIDHFKTDKDYRNSDGVRRKKTRWGGSDPLCAAVQPPKPSKVRGSLPPAHFEILRLRRRHSRSQDQNQI